MSEWKECRLGDKHIDLISGFAFKSKNFFEYQAEESLPVIKIKNVANGDVNLEKVVYHQYNKSLEKYMLAFGDILIAMTGNHPQAQAQVVGNVSKYKLETEALLNQRVGKIVTKGKNDLDFFYYFFKDEDTHSYLANNSSGSANQANISRNDILNLISKIPELPEQKAIAEVLSSLDDKIDLLHRQNKTLEQMAETLFRQWFIERKAQPSLNPSQREGGDAAKEDWEVGILDDILTVKGGTTPSTKNPEFWDGEIHWTTPRDLSNNSNMFLFDTLRKITKKGLERISSGLLPIGTLLLSSRAPVGYLAFSEVPIAINQGYIAIIDDKSISKYWIYLWIKENMDYIKSHANGSTFQEISKTSFKKLQVLIPSKEVLERFNTIIKVNFDKIRTNTKQIRTLEKMRDTLLPKLMSGEMKINIEIIEELI